MTQHGTELSHADLMAMSRSALDDLYRGIETPGATPAGDTRGTAVVFPGSWVGHLLSGLARLVAWQGKVFNPAQDGLRNKITPLRFRSIRASVYRGESWMDGGEATIIDYSRTSIVARWIRDEVREVSPGLWLGKVFLRRWHVLDFTLEA